MVEGSGVGSRDIPLTNGSGSWRPKTYDPDPQHFKAFFSSPTPSIIYTDFLTPSINNTVLSCVWTDLKGECLETQQQNQSFLFSQEGGGGGDARLDMGKAFPLKGLCHEMDFLCWQLGMHG
jgi:hypothetical protein